MYYHLTESEQDKLKDCPTTEPAPRGVASCGRHNVAEREHAYVICTLMAGHRGPHVAHGWNANICRVWED